MTRGNQREKARAKAQNDAAGVKKKNTKSGSETARDKENVAKIMREKQEKADAAKKGGEATSSKK